MCFNCSLIFWKDIVFVYPFFFGLGILQFDYNAAQSGLVRVQPISYLEIIQLLGFVDTCTSSSLGILSHFLLQIVSLPLFILFFGDSHDTYIGPLLLSYKSPRFYSLFFFLFFSPCSPGSNISVVLSSGLPHLSLACSVLPIIGSRLED